jgi:hypothetical protein
MDLKDELLNNSPDGDRQEEQAVIICLQFPIGKLQGKKALAAVFDLDDILREVVETSGVGISNGHNTCVDQEEDSVMYYIYGANANRIYQVIKPILQSLPSLQEVSITKRYSQFSEEQFHQQ